MSGYIAENAIIRDSTFSEEIRLYRNAVLSASKCASGVSIGDDTTVERCVIGRHVALNRRSYFNDSTIGDYSYAGINTTMNFAKVGKFCSIARNVDIGGFDHDYHKVTTMPLFRMRQMLFNEKPTTSHNEYCIIGNDVWIAAGAQILHKVTVGDGAVIGGGAVVTKDIPPYAIAVGVPARVIKYRFDDATISALLEIKWWDWPEEALLNNIDWLIASDVTPEVLTRMRAISEKSTPESIG